MLTKKKKLFAQAREGGLTPTESAKEAGCSQKYAKQSGYRYEHDDEVKRYRDKISGRIPNVPDPEPVVDGDPVKVEHSAKDIKPMHDIDNESYATTILRAQLHSDDERIAQGAAKALLDYEVKKKAAAGVKGNRDQNAKQAAEVSRFKPRAV